MPLYTLVDCNVSDGESAVTLIPDPIQLRCLSPWYWPRKNKNTKFEVWCLLNVYCISTIIKLKNHKPTIASRGSPVLFSVWWHQINVHSPWWCQHQNVSTGYCVNGHLHGFELNSVCLCSLQRSLCISAFRLRVPSCLPSIPHQAELAFSARRP